MSDAFPRRRQFTLAQLMASVAVVCILLAIAVVAVQRSYDDGYARTHCLNNLRGLIISVHNYHDAPNWYWTFGSWHPKGVVLFAAGDAAVRQVKITTDPRVLGFFAGRNDRTAYTLP
ncbi:MAG: hypothetical protein HYS13_10440 [Planctomycetia bacterium]|nr:hypothetical protein [Planctomycetia bacterium]